MHCELSRELYTILLSLILVPINAQHEQSRLVAELQIADLELQDDCEQRASKFKSSLISNNFSEMVNARTAYGLLLKDEAHNLKSYEEDVPFDTSRNWTVLTKSGDGLLPDKDWHNLVSYSIANYELTHSIKINCDNSASQCMFAQAAYDHVLADSKNETFVKKSWSTWQTLLALRKKHFSNILNLVSKAALLNDKEGPKSYWEMLVELEGAYEKADDLWEKIKPLYFKLQHFVKARLVRFYNINSTSSNIPVYLLGSNFGYDWSYIADIILPHPQIHYDAKTYLHKKQITDMYRVAEEITGELSLGAFGEQFWTNSLFNMSFCENHVVSFCEEKRTELFTCKKTNWVTYLDAFETALDVTLRNADYLALPRQNLRYSALDEAVTSLGSFLAIKNLRYKEIWDKRLFDSNVDQKANEMAELLLIALRILPRLPYYLAADKWRLHVLETRPNNIEQAWWKLRKDFQGVEGIFNNETDYLGDPYITSNKPYISKFLGTILQFQLLQYYHQQEPGVSVIQSIRADENFLIMIKERAVRPWPELISLYYGLDELDASYLLEYFQPLSDYLASAPLEQQEISTTTEKTVTKRTKEAIAVVSSKQESKTIEEISLKQKEVERDHARDLEEGPQLSTEKTVMYIGLSLLGVVAALVVFVIVSRLVKRKGTNNRRFETCCSI